MEIFTRLSLAQGRGSWRAWSCKNTEGRLVLMDVYKEEDDKWEAKQSKISLAFFGIYVWSVQREKCDENFPLRPFQLLCVRRKRFLWRMWLIDAEIKYCSWSCGIFTRIRVQLCSCFRRWGLWNKVRTIHMVYFWNFCIVKNRHHLRNTKEHRQINLRNGYSIGFRKNILRESNKIFPFMFC